MSGIIAVYSLVVSVLIVEEIRPPSPSERNYSLFSYVLLTLGTPRKLANIERGFMHLGCGIAVGLTGLSAGYCIGVVGDHGVRAYMEQSKVYVGMILILIFGEVLGLYGFVIQTQSPRRN